jgi:PAS domain S-box-containing protein
MPNPLKLLIVEDNPADAEMELLELQRAGFAPEWERVDTEEAFLARLHGGLDLVLSDYAMPRFSGLRALELLKKSGLDVPFILVSGTIGEDLAVVAMKNGATDYLLKDRLVRLGPAVTHAMTENRLRHERRETNEALRVSEGRYRTLFEHAPDGIVIADPHGRYLDANASICQMLGYARAELIGLHSADVVAPTETSQIEPALKAIATKAEYHREWHFRRKDGSIFPAEVVATTMPDGNVLGMIRDITERKSLEAQFLRAQRVESIGTLASGVAHDLNNILAPVLMAAGLLKSKLTEQRDRDLLGLVERSAQRGANIVGQLLTFSRGIEGARGIIQPRHLLKEMVSIMRETFPKNIEISQDVASDLWCVVADSTQLHQVLLNLCVNARDAMPQGGKLSLAGENVQLDKAQAKLSSLPIPGPYLVLSVTDTGHGIPPEIIARIFDPFFTTKALGKGTGLGLSTVLGIAKSHGGTVVVSSTPAHGTVFKVYLPATPDRTDAKDVASGTPSARGQLELILVVDDEAPIREMSARVLRDRGYRVLLAENGEDAIKLFIEHHGAVRLVLTDLMMPGMSTVDMIRALQILEPGIRIIATSGMEREGKRAELAEMGVTQMLAKPCAPEVMLKAIEQALAGPAPAPEVSPLDSNGRKEMAGAPAAGSVS